MARVVISPGWQGRMQVTTNRIANKVADAIADDVRRYSPVDTGAMVAGVDTEPSIDGTAYVTVSRDVPGDDEKVPVYVEYGTRNMAAQPFIRPAAYQRRSV